jgi:hypothetical protein
LSDRFQVKILPEFSAFNPGLKINLILKLLLILRKAQRPGEAGFFWLFDIKYYL